jgi:DNA-binding GntR family transcriptional regulator
MAGDGTIARSVLADQVKDRLLQDILTGRYPPDSRIIETRVARELGVSQAPVREALRGLEATGVVEIEPYRGARVRRPTTDELLEAFTVRAELESYGARLAVERIDEEDVGALAGLLEAMHRAARANDRHDLALNDAAFHGAILAMSGNATLVRVWRALEPFSRTYITLLVPGVDPVEIADLHEPILDAIRRRDPELLDRVLRRHFVDAAAKLDRGWGRQPDAPAMAAARSGGGAATRD